MRPVAVLAAITMALPTAAQTPPAADPAVRLKADALVAILDGRGNPASDFAASFRQAVSDEKLTAIFAQLRAALGRPRAIEQFTATSPWSADLVVGYDNGTASVRLALDPAAPYAITGLLITGTAARDDSLTRLEADLRALPGASGLGLYALGEGGPTPIMEVNGDVRAPLGSAFKLWVLAEAARQIDAGERHWTDIVPVGPASLPSGILQTWPTGTPMTLQGLATLMISISDNTATDTLLAALGRTKVDAMASLTGGMAPVPTTRETFVIKGDAALTAAWKTGDTATRRRLLADNATRIARARLDAGLFAGKPVAVESVEWFASPRAMARLLDRLRRGSDTVRAILAVNPGIDRQTARRFAYLGFKGGSEPGVIAANFVAKGKDGRWYAVTGNWHRIDAAVEDVRFMGLMNRALALVAAR